MGFYGLHFNFNNQSTYNYGLMIENFTTSGGISGSKFASPKTAVEDRLPNRYDTLLYGETQNTPLELNITVGIDPDSYEHSKFLTRDEVRAINVWLIRTGGGYKYLEIIQDDMNSYRYKCRLVDSETIEIGNLIVGLNLKFLCDSPFGYKHSETVTTVTTTTKSITVVSEHDNEGYYYPNLEITLGSGVTSISLKNETDNNNTFTLSGFTNTSGMVITVDNKNQLISSTVISNMYQYFNYNFFKLLRGENSITITGASSVKIISEVPVDIGG